MKTKEGQKIKISFPIRAYFRQLIYPNTDVRLINPFSFWHKFRIGYLEACWEINIVQRLERCLQIECQQPFQRETGDISNSLVQSGRYRGVPWKKLPHKIVFASQPSFELKYRGVAYHTGSIVVIDTNKVEIKPDSVTLNSSKNMTAECNNSDFSKTSSDI